MNRIRHWLRIGRTRSTRRGNRAPADFSSLSCRLAALLVLIGSLALMVAKDSGLESRGRIAGWLTGQAIAVLLGSWWLSRSTKRRERGLQFAFPLAVALILMPFLWEPMSRHWRQQGQTLEGLILDGFRNMMLVLSVFADRTSIRKLCVTGSLFLMVFASCLSSDPLLLGLLVLYTVLGIWWLMDSYWNSLRAKQAIQTTVHLPKKWWLGLAGFVAALLLALSFASHQASIELSGFLPSSGGTDWSDPYARAGVNDGDMLVGARDSARTFGPIESEIFMDSEQQSLYDVFNELYGDPPRKNGKQERTVALPPGLLREQEQRMATGSHAGSEFSTNRSPPKNAREALKDVASDALFHVKGRVPLHLRLQVFDLFDGEDWFPAATIDSPPAQAMTKVRGKPWLPLNHNGSLDVYAREESHTLKIHKLRMPIIPLPLHAIGVHIDRIDQSDFFAYEQASVLRMTRGRLPDQIVIHVASCAFDESRLSLEKPAFPTASERTCTLPMIPDAERWKSLAQEWTREVPRGWPQVQAIVRRLREFEVVRNDHTSWRTSPTTTSDSDAESIARFLETRRGPDYLFATSAAMLLRSLGFSTRVVAGFYADPANYDARQKHTAVFKEDIHFWPEVYLGVSTWTVIEPTPGYEVLGPPLSWWEAIASAIQSSGAWLWSHRLAVTLICLLSTLLLRFRILCLDWLARMWWSVTASRSDRRMILNASRLLDRRCRWIGVIRPRHTSAARWLLKMQCRSAEVQEFARLVEWAEFAPADQSWASLQVSQSPRDLCVRVLQTCTMKSLWADRQRFTALSQHSPHAECPTHRAATTFTTMGT